MTETVELERAAARFRAQAAQSRVLAGVLRAAADLSWTGPGAGAYRESVAERWAALVRLAEVQDEVADELHALAGLLAAA